MWEEGQQTAIRSARGSTTLSWDVWDGGDATHDPGTNRHRLELVVAEGELADEVDRLVALGASRLGTTQDGAVALADRDGNEFHLRTAPAHGVG